MLERLAIGDVVNVVKIGNVEPSDVSWPMTVEFVESIGDDVRCGCVWFEHEHLRHAVFPAACLNRTDGAPA